MSLKNFAKKSAITAWVLWGSAVAANAYAPEALEATVEAWSQLAWVTTGIASSVATWVNSLLWPIPMVGSAAPFALPVAGGIWAGNKLAKMIDSESKALRWAGRIGWGVAGAATMGTAAGAYATTVGAGVGLYYGGKYWWKAVRWVAGWVAGWVKWILSWSKNGWQNAWS